MPPKSKTQQRILVVVLVLIGLLITVFFGMRALHALRRFNGHRPPPPGKVETDVELIRDWMTVPFISRMYRVPDEIIFQALGIPPKNNRDKSLLDLNREYYPDTEGFVIAQVKSTILAHQPPPEPASAPTAVSPPTAPAP